MRLVGPKLGLPGRRSVIAGARHRHPREHHRRPTLDDVSCSSPADASRPNPTSEPLQDTHPHHLSCASSIGPGHASDIGPALGVINVGVVNNRRARSTAPNNLKPNEGQHVTSDREEGAFRFPSSLRPGPWLGRTGQIRRSTTQLTGSLIRANTTRRMPAIQYGR